MFNKQTIILLFSFIFSLSAVGQISQGGVPPSFSHMNTLRSVSSVASVPVNLDVNRLIWEDEIVERNDGPAKIAEVLPVDIDIERTGNWITYPDSVKIWQQTIYAEGAKGLIISYKDFYIPEGAQLFIYNEDHSHILGAYTRSTHPQGGVFATEVISGEKVTLEYVASAVSTEKPRIVIDEVGYVYNTKTMLRYTPNINGSASCMININCSEGDNWKNQKRGVVLITVQIGSRWYGCTGSMVNNTRRDGTPYLLTANHCFVNDGDPKFETLIVYFNHEFPTCLNENVFPTTSKTITGTELLISAPLTETTNNITIKGSDGALLKLKQDVPLEWKPYYNGWDRRDVSAHSGVVIHHPNFDVKKIVVYDKDIVTDTYNGDYLGATNAYWRVQYNGTSVTQGGSSGAPIFSQEGLIVGTLSGGRTSCNDKFQFDFYGKFGYHWDYYPEANRRLKTYLDPINEGTMTLKGYDPNYTSGTESEITDNALKDLVIFPTVVDDELNINTNSIIKAIKIYDLAGRQVYLKSGYNASTTSISVNGWTKGVYSIVVQTEINNLTDKFVKK